MWAVAVLLVLFAFSLIAIGVSYLLSSSGHRNLVSGIAFVLTSAGCIALWQGGATTWVNSVDASGNRIVSRQERNADQFLAHIVWQRGTWRVTTKEVLGVSWLAAVAVLTVWQSRKRSKTEN